MSIKIKTIQNFETYFHNDRKVQIEDVVGEAVLARPSLTIDYMQYKAFLKRLPKQDFDKYYDSNFSFPVSVSRDTEDYESHI